jgi:hypothetical protein
LNKLKKLDKKNLEDISQFFSTISNEIILNSVPSKELLDLDINIKSTYDNGKLDVVIDVDLDLDEFSDINDEDLNKAISESYSKLDEFINENYRE